jgi:hypothetical protein
VSAVFGSSLNKGAVIAKSASRPKSTNGFTLDDTISKIA